MKAKLRKGFTLIEILIVVVLVAIMAAVVVPRFARTSDDAKKAANKANKANINTQVELYHFDTTNWPATTLLDVATNDSYFPDGLPTCPFVGVGGDTGSYTLGSNNRVTGHAH